jgi:signal transduction histidine kinase
VSTVVLDDPWQARLDRMRRLLPLPLLAVSTAGALVSPSRPHTAPATGVVLALAAAAWSAAVTMRMRPRAPAGWRLTAFAGHTLLAGALVWFDTWYGVFAYSGFLLAYALGARLRLYGFAATALVVSASMSGGYPFGPGAPRLTYLLVAAVLVVLVLHSASITNRAVEQNQDRGRMIHELAEANRRLEASMAENACLHAQLLAQARTAGVIEERQRLAGEIHDTLAQGMTAIVAQLQATEQARNRPEEWTRHLAQAQALARSGLTEARRSVRALRPEQLENAGLPEALAELARDWSRRSGVAAELETSGTPVRAGVETESAVFRVAQEALANVAKHAGASKVRLTLTYLDDTLLLDVADDGTGFDAPAEDGTDAAAGGYGLVGMRRRLARVGGTLTVESTPGYGTTVNASVPLACAGAQR